MTANTSGDITIENESGNVIEAKNIWIQKITGLIYKNLSESEFEKTSCLKFIDSYGDTTFNRDQIAVLIKEFEMLFNKCQIEEEKETFKEIIEFITRAKNQIHIYVKFHGD